MKKKILFCFIMVGSVMGYSQQTPASEEDLKTRVLALQADVDNIKVNLAVSEKKFKRGILVATIGYAVTITGGLMLGRQNDKAGQVLLVAGGVTGATGTVLMVDSFKYLGRAGRERKK